jgi:hypothetical protein
MSSEALRAQQGNDEVKEQKGRSEPSQHMYEIHSSLPWLMPDVVGWSLCCDERASRSQSRIRPHVSMKNASSRPIKSTSTIAIPLPDVGIAMPRFHHGSIASLVSKARQEMSLAGQEKIKTAALEWTKASIDIQPFTAYTMCINSAETRRRKTYDDAHAVNSRSSCRR